MPVEYNKSINAMTPGDEIEGYYILKSANPKVAANGKPFLTGALSDRTGTMELKVWDYAGPLTAADEGTVVKVRGTVGEYRGTAQFTAARIRQAAQEHLVMGAQDAAETAARLGVPEEKSVLLQHLILSHHGEPEFGAAVRPLCAEAELLSLIDAVDSRMEIYRETYDTMEPDTFSPRIFALEKKVFRHA